MRLRLGVHQFQSSWSIFDIKVRPLLVVFGCAAELEVDCVIKIWLLLEEGAVTLLSYQMLLLCVSLLGLLSYGVLRGEHVGSSAFTNV